MICIYKALLHVLSNYLTNFISFRNCNVYTCSLESLILDVPTIRTILGKTVFQSVPLDVE